MSANTMPITMLNGFGCDCQKMPALGCPDCGGTCVSGLGNVLTDAGDIGKKVAVVVGIAAFSYFAYKVFSYESKGSK